MQITIKKILDLTKSLKEDTHPLITKGLIVVKHNRENTPMFLTDKGKRLFLEDEYFLYAPDYNNVDRYKFAQFVSESYTENTSGDKDTLKKIEEIEAANPQLSFIQKLEKKYPIDLRTMIYIIAHNTANGTHISFFDLLEKIYDKSDRRLTAYLFKEKKSPLQEDGLVEIMTHSSLFGEHTLILLTNTAKELFFEEDAYLYIDKSNDKNLLKADDIAQKQLFFSEQLTEQISLVSNSLHEQNYTKICERMEQQHLPKGIAALFYGTPGTGKTESVMQIAKATGRDVMHVDISQSKSMWFGESEKIIKEVFTQYKRLCKESKIKPILLFNEADAIFSKRKDVNSGSLAQTENAIQNIILEEMEKLDGILMATTNLTNNLDPAFERRFLFKVQFDRPTTEAKANIWHNKIPTLTTDEAKELANEFDFSGGEIDNIVRRATMQDIIGGNGITLASLKELCKTERLFAKGNKKIGF